MSDPKHPKVGDKTIDASDVDLVDITPERIRELSKLRDGYEKAIQNVVELNSDAVTKAGLNPTEIQRLSMLATKNAYLGELHAAAEKLTELLKETRLETRHEIATLLGEMAAQTRRRADRATNGAEILGPLAALLEYQSRAAKQAAATKEKEKQSQTPE